MNRTCAGLLVVLVATTGCSVTLHRVAVVGPAAAVVGCGIADVVTTQRGFERGGVEGNATTGVGGSQRIGVLAAEKAVATGLVVTGVWYLQTHNHPTAARWFGYLGAAPWCVAAAHNETVNR